jgi:hypothetical protein
MNKQILLESDRLQKTCMQGIIKLEFYSIHKV